MLTYVRVRVSMYGVNMPYSARYYTNDKSKLLGDVSFIKKNNYPKNKLKW